MVPRNINNKNFHSHSSPPCVEKKNKLDTSKILDKSGRFNKQIPASQSKLFGAIYICTYLHASESPYRSDARFQMSGASRACSSRVFFSRSRVVSTPQPAMLSYSDIVPVLIAAVLRCINNSLLLRVHASISVYFVCSQM